MAYIYMFPLCLGLNILRNTTTTISAKKMKMTTATSFCDSHTLVMLLLLCFMYFFLIQSPVVTGEDVVDEDFSELLSREEMVQMAGYGEEKLSTVLVTGSVHCEAHNFHGKADHQLHAWPIPGALVAVNCHSHGGGERRGKSTVARGVTDEYGEFMIDLPSYLHAIPNLEKICRVKVHQMPKNSKCQPDNVNKRHKKLILSTFGNGIRTYSAGNLRFFQHSNSKPLHA